jgi:hypothetical protein
MPNPSFVLMLSFPVLAVMLLIPLFMLVDFLMGLIDGIRN